MARQSCRAGQGTLPTHLRGARVRVLPGQVIGYRRQRALDLSGAAIADLP
jgi:hypothetical protein